MEEFIALSKACPHNDQEALLWSSRLVKFLDLLQANPETLPDALFSISSETESLGVMLCLYVGGI